ncbi:fatty acid desaturase family protein [Pseudomonas chlororaphis]|uniref:fatty acid desaturase family protein n=1 Tax=Pseudomonas chlororaphis TaxID=587753 RepID=UPI0003D3A7C7|nr:fatty acid desaturase [Pseudomonas chlororaphis]AZD31600.1 fatty acid desaturase [Pseudomonas chlororaphis]ETD40446.1 fatty acid desaturase [Pseudomonas chlororaphis subsp. aurantiaca PB-St2]QFS56915.1 fatty acid desaturase [Pseudomonas chlororaphis subsp. aurantiaca]
MNHSIHPATEDQLRLAKRAELRVDRERQAQLQALMQPQPLKFVLWSLLHVLVWCAAALYILLGDNPWGLALAVLVLGNQLHAFTVLQHDCGHASGFRSAALNLWVGRFMAWFIVFPFSSFTECHKYHHRYLGDPHKDPDDWNYTGGVKWMFLRIAVFVPRFIYFSLVRYGKAVRNRVLRELAFNLLSMAAIGAWCYSQGLMLQFVLIFIVPLLLLALVINPISRGYEHFPMATLEVGDPQRLDLAKNTVTVSDRLIGLLWANINYHVEHHIYPGVPFVNLPRLAALLDNKPYLRDRWLLARLFARRPVTTCAEPRRAT